MGYNKGKHEKTRSIRDWEPGNPSPLQNAIYGITALMMNKKPSPNHVAERTEAKKILLKHTPAASNRPGQRWYAPVAGS